LGVWNNYIDKTPQRVKLVDAFMAFLVVVGVLQFVYCVIAGNYVRIPPVRLRKIGKVTGGFDGLTFGVCTAFQRFPLRLFGDSRPIRAHGELAYADQPGE